MERTIAVRVDVFVRLKQVRHTYDVRLMLWVDVVQRFTSVSVNFVNYCTKRLFSASESADSHGLCKRSRSFFG